MSEDLVFRRAEPRDVPGMARLAGALVRMHHRVDPSRFFLVDEVEKGYAWWFGREIERSGVIAVVALQAERVVGYAYGTLEERDWNMLLDEHGALHDVFVDEAARGRGVGERLVREAVAALERLGAPRVVLSTMVSNETAQRLFRRCGFRPTMLEMMRDRETVASLKGG